MYQWRRDFAYLSREQFQNEWKTNIVNLSLFQAVNLQRMRECQNSKKSSKFWLPYSLSWINSLRNTITPIREGVKKTELIGTLSQIMGRWVQRWVQSPKLFSENNHSVIFTSTSRNVLKHVIHKWGGHIWPFHDVLRPQRWNFVRKISHFFKKNQML